MEKGVSATKATAETSSALGFSEPNPHLKVKFDVKFENNYRVNLTREDYFEVDSILINGHRFVNLRSIHGHISDVNFTISDPMISEQMMRYLTYQNNVELINILSRDLNKFNYFEIYDKTKKTEKQISKQEILNDSEHRAIARCSYINEILNKEGHINPEKLYRHTNPNIPIFTSINFNELNFYPIWFINGNKYTKSKYCPLFCHFDILIHILSKVFIDFKALILKLAGTDIQIVKEKNQTVEDYSEHSHDELVKIIFKEKQKNNNLREEFRIFREESRKRHEELMREHSETKKLLEETRQESNQRFTDLDNSQKTRFDEVAALISQALDGTETNINQSIPDEKLTTGTTREIFVIINHEGLINDFRSQRLINEREIVLDTIVCQCDDLDKHLGKHEFNEEKDMIIFRAHTNNSLDIFKYIKENIRRNVARIYSKGKYRRKIIVNRLMVDVFLLKIREFVDSTVIPKTRLTSSIGRTKTLITDFVREKMEETSREVASKMYTEVRQLREEIQTSKEQLREQVSQVQETVQEVREEARETQEQVRETIQEAVTQVREELRQEIHDEVVQQVEQAVTNRLLEYVNRNRYTEIYFNKYYRELFVRDSEGNYHSLTDEHTGLTLVGLFVHPYKASRDFEEITDDPENYKFR